MEEKKFNLRHVIPDAIIFVDQIIGRKYPECNEGGEISTSRRDAETAGENDCIGVKNFYISKVTEDTNMKS